MPISPFLKVPLKLRKPPVLLLEVLIAFAIVVLCALPLLTPHYAMLRAQQTYRNQLNLDHAVNLFYGQVIQQLYLNQIPWEDLQQKPLEISSKMLHEAGIDPKSFPFRGTFIFSPKKTKPSKPGPESVWLYNLDFNFFSVNGAQQNYHYEVFIVRKLG